MTDKIEVKVFNGAPSAVGKEGYMAVRGKNVVAFYVDVCDVPNGRLYPYGTCKQTVNHQTFESFDFPCIFLDDGEDGEMLDVAFPEFEGWAVHSAFGGKTLSICLVKHDRQ